MEHANKFAEVILPVPIPGCFTYSVPDELTSIIEPGKRVIVPFGKKRIIAGIVRKISESFDEHATLKEIIDVIDQNALIQETHFRLWEWMAQYYMCSIGEIMIAAMPNTFRLESETQISLNPSYEGDLSGLSDKAFLVAEALRYTDRLTLDQISEIVDQKKVVNIINTLIDQGVVVSAEKITEGYRPKLVTTVKLAKKYHSENDLKDLFDDLGKRAFKQLEVLMSFLQYAGDNPYEVQISRKQLLRLADSSPAVLKSLIDKGVFEELQTEVSRLGNFEPKKSADGIIFNPAQQNALEEIRSGFKEGKPVLLHGITGSGKTEVYIQLIDQVISEGKQALFMLPEIALTSQIINRLRTYFGNKVQVYHSRASEMERTEIWNKLVNFNGLDEDTYVIVGARSSLFLPLKNPGLVIVDEEHDYSFKQYDPAPRYQARDSAVMLAALFNIPVILGSATPAIESWHNAVAGKYHLVNLPVRYGSGKIPEVIVANVLEARRNKELKSWFTPVLLSKIKDALASDQQIILFQNRRGFSLRVTCADCGWYPDCPHCDVSLTYHKFIDKLKCHYCGYLRKVPHKCDECSSTHIITSGFGTERIEEEIALLLPQAKVRRMDFDTTRTKNSYQQIIEDFEKRSIDILIGTQMVTKGLDFSHVSVVGVMNADQMIAFPDFRSFERSFQHIVQVSGRAGRQSEKGVVIIQTTRPTHDVIVLAKNHNYKGLYASQIAERQLFHYPPFSRLIRVICKSKNTEAINNTSRSLAYELRKTLGRNAVLGPEYPLVAKIKDEYLRHILIKLTPDKDLQEKKHHVRKVIDHIKASPDSKKVRIIIDVDPY